MVVFIKRLQKYLKKFKGRLTNEDEAGNGIQAAAPHFSLTHPSSCLFPLQFEAELHHPSSFKNEGFVFQLWL